MRVDWLGGKVYYLVRGMDRGWVRMNIGGD